MFALSDEIFEKIINKWSSWERKKMNDKNVGNELADIKSETLCLSEQKKVIKTKKTSFHQK